MSTSRDTGSREVLALIPARGGSKSIPRKNLQLLNGHPLISYSIRHANGANIDRVIVTTDDAEIAETAKSYGAEVPFLRPEGIAGDLATDVEFHRHALEWLKTNEGYEPDFVVNLRPPHPIRRLDTINRAIEVFANSSADSLRSVRLATESPFKMWTINLQGLLDPVAKLEGIEETYNQPRQMLPLVYWQDGYIDITRPSIIYEQNSTTGTNILPFVIDEVAIDIDYEDELEEAERLMNATTGTAHDPAPATRPDDPVQKTRFPS